MKTGMWTMSSNVIAAGTEGPKSQIEFRRYHLPRYPRPDPAPKIPKSTNKPSPTRSRD